MKSLSNYFAINKFKKKKKEKAICLIISFSWIIFGTIVQISVYPDYNFFEFNYKLPSYQILNLITLPSNFIFFMLIFSEQINDLYILLIFLQSFNVLIHWLIIYKLWLYFQIKRNKKYAKKKLINKSDFTISKILTVSIIFIICIMSFLRIFLMSFSYDSIYSNSETYIIKKPCKESIEDMSNFKKENSEYILTITSKSGEKGIRSDGINKFRPNIYIVYFYIKDIDLGINCVLECSNNKKTYLGLYSVSKGQSHNVWYGINTEKISKDDNKMIIQIFEKEILDNIFNKKWKRKQFNSPIKYCNKNISIIAS